MIATPDRVLCGYSEADIGPTMSEHSRRSVVRILLLFVTVLLRGIYCRSAVRLIKASRADKLPLPGPRLCRLEFCIMKTRIRGLGPMFQVSAFALLFVLVAIQFLPVAKPVSQGKVNSLHASQMIDPAVGKIVDRACMDCHSSNTHWPWYGRVAPMSWILARDISRGRAKLDFSHWPYEAHTSNQRMEICDAVSDGSMPLKAYTFMHHGARLSSQDVDQICDWASAPAAAASRSRHNGPMETK